VERRQHAVSATPLVNATVPAAARVPLAPAAWHAALRQKEISCL
jgi:hypothetical protein